MTPRGRESTKLCGNFALHNFDNHDVNYDFVNDIEDRCNIGLQTMLAMYIDHFLYVMKTRARQTRSFTLNWPRQSIGGGYQSSEMAAPLN